MGAEKFKTVAVAMSGGVDSSMSALVLKQAGIDVFGINMILFGADIKSRKIPKERPDDMAPDLDNIAESLGISIHRIHMEELFEKEVMDFFIKEYLSGRTPNPCVLCNQRVKFGALWEKAKDLGAQALATGHYARIENEAGSGKYRLLRGVDSSKDQSYFLFRMSQDRLERTIFPLGRMRKRDVREMARLQGMSFRDKGESQDICFISGGKYNDFIRDRIPMTSFGPGEIVDERGRVLGMHKGIIDFTVGQRKKLGELKGKGYFVLALLPEVNRIVVGPESSLYKDHMLVRDVNWITGPPAEGDEVQVQVRYNSPPAPCVVRVFPGDKAIVAFEKPQKAITPGQAAVFYNSDETLGGGWIDRDEGHDS